MLLAKNFTGTYIQPYTECYDLAHASYRLLFWGVLVYRHKTLSFSIVWRQKQKQMKLSKGRSSLLHIEVENYSQGHITKKIRFSGPPASTFEGRITLNIGPQQIKSPPHQLLAD